MFKKLKSGKLGKKDPIQLVFPKVKLKEGFFGIFALFFKALSHYIYSKIQILGFVFIRFTRFVVSSADRVKGFLVIKLMWGRGRLGRPSANGLILSIAFVVFLTGGVFSSSDFVNSSTISPDYLIRVDDITPEVIIATTSLPEGRRLEAVVHEVSSGESLSSIGSLYKVTTDALKYVNNLTSDNLKIGQKIVVPPIQGVIYKVKAGDTCDSIGKEFDVASQAILDFNYLESCSTLLAGKELIIPDAKIPAPQIVFPSGETYSRYVDPNPGVGWCQWPTTVRIITQYFTYYHNGLDIATPWGHWPPIYACGGGTVTRAGWDPWGLGLHVIIDHGNGYVTVYGHMSKLAVSVGQDVDKGDVIGIMGNTGNSTGPHLHFIIKYKGRAQNPLNYTKP